MKKVVPLLFVATALCCGKSLLSKLSPDLATAAPATSTGLLRVIIQWNPGVSSPSQRIIALGGTVLSEYQQTNSGTYLVPPSAFDTLTNDSDVKYISADRTVHRKLANAAAAIGAPAVWKAGYTGAGIGVAVIDSGISARQSSRPGKQALWWLSRPGTKAVITHSETRDTEPSLFPATIRMSSRLAP